MKIKEICEKTGLTDRTVRFYIQEQLIAPFYTENYLGRKSFDFSEQDLQKLESIATLRSFGFTVEEIKELLSSGTDTQQIVAAVQRRTEEDLGEMKYRHTVLSELDASEQMDIDTLVKRLSDTDHVVKNEGAGMNRRSFLAVFKSCLMFLAVWLPIMIAISILLFKFYVLETPTISPIFFVCTFLCFFPSTAAILFFPRLGGARKNIRVILIGLCVICLPLGAFFSAKSVIVCDHKYQSYRTTVEATCQNSGEVIMKCKKCGDFKVQSVEKLSHKAVAVEGITPTCSTSGISEGSVCLHCDTVLVEQSVLPPTNIHTPVKIGAAVAATCKDTGLTEGSRCSVCNKTLVAQTVVPVTND
ncbi:MAG: MerR family transcriptional regulator, partial [Clostridia bacterium]|nr:MerR family transcriptional regulator [Clostridia bacterium]